MYLVTFFSYCINNLELNKLTSLNSLNISQHAVPEWKRSDKNEADDRSDHWAVFVPGEGQGATELNTFKPGKLQ